MIVISVWISLKMIFLNCTIFISTNFYTQNKQLIFNLLYTYPHSYPHNKPR